MAMEHSPIHQKLKKELDSAFDDVSSDEDDEVDDRKYEQPFEKVKLKGWTDNSLKDSAKKRARRFLRGQSDETMPVMANPFFRTGRLAAVLLRVKARFLLLHAMSKLPRPKPPCWTDLHSLCYVHDFRNIAEALKGLNTNQINTALRGPKFEGITPLHLLIRPYHRIRERHMEPHVVAAVKVNILKLLRCKAAINANVCS